MSNPYLKKAVAKMGSQTAMAAKLRELMPGRPISQTHVWKWLNMPAEKAPPGEYVIPIVIAVDGDVTPHQLRADLYPDRDWLPAQVQDRNKAA